MRTFRQFAMQQVARCESLPSGPGYIFSENAQVEIRNWLEARSDIPPTATRQSDLQWLEESQAARRIKAVIDDVMEGDRAPALSDIRGVWARLHGKNPTVNRECPDCHGTGYQIVIYKSGEGARRCPRGCVPPANDYRPEIKRELPANPILGELLAGIRAKKAVLEPKQGAS